METPEPPEWFHILKDDGLLTREINGHVYRFTKQNTTAYMFQEPYAQMNHIWYRADAEHGTYIFDCEETIEELYNEGYGMTYPANPSDTDVECYIIWESLKLELYLKDLPPDLTP